MAQKSKKKSPISNRIATVFMNAVLAGMRRRPIDDPNFSRDEWKTLLDLSVEQDLLPIVFESVYSLLPKELEAVYRACSVKWVADQVQKTELFLRIYRELQKEGIEPLVVKGIVCRETYELSDWRVSSDEDIYMPQAEFMHFHEVMCRIGFQSTAPNFQSEHETVYKGGGITIEGHWKLFPQETRRWEYMNIQAADIMRRARHVDIDGTRILTPEPTDHMIYLLLHAMKHFSLAGVGIRQICDIAMWAQTYTIDWHRVRNTIDCFNGACFASAVLDAANKHFGMEFPEGWRRVDSTNLIRDSLEGGAFGHSTEDRLHSATITAGGDGQKGIGPGAILRSLFPGRKVMEINYPWVSRSRMLLPVGWCVRLIRYARNVGRGASPLRSLQIGRQRVKLLQEYGVLADTSER